MDLINIDPATINTVTTAPTDSFWRALGRQGSWYWTIDHEKVKEYVLFFDRLRDKSEHALGKIYYEVREKIRAEVIQWDYEFYKDPAKIPEYTTFEKWCDDHSPLSYSRVKHYIWIYENVRDIDAPLGYKPNKLIADSIKDREVQDMIRDIVRELSVSQTEIKKMFENHLESIRAWAEEQRTERDIFEKELRRRITGALERIRNNTGAELINIASIELTDKGVLVKGKTKGENEKILNAITELETEIKKRAWKM